MKDLLRIVDFFFCKYLGLEIEKTFPYQVALKNNRIIICSLLRRHVIYESLENYKSHTSKISFNNMETRKLGKAIGKTIASNLTISFNEAKLTLEQNKNG